MKPKTTKNKFTPNMLVLNNAYINCLYNLTFKLGVVPVRRKKENTNNNTPILNHHMLFLSNPQKPLAQYSGSPFINAKLKEGTDLKMLLRNR